MTDATNHLLPESGEPLTAGWEPDVAADDSIVRNYLLTLSDRLITMARLTEGRVDRGDDALLADLGSSYVFDNIAIGLGPWSDASYRGIVRRAEAFFGPGRAFTVMALSSSVDLGPLGLRLVGHPPLMWRPPGGTGPVAPPGLDIRPVRTATELADFEQTLVAAYPLPSGGSITDQRLLDGGLSAWVGYVDGMPVATAGSHTAHGLTEVEWVSTLPTHRGRGLGALLTWAATTVEPDLPAALLATDDGRPVYRRLGYVPVIRLTMWLRPGEVASRASTMLRRVEPAVRDDHVPGGVST